MLNLLKINSANSKTKFFYKLNERLRDKPGHVEKAVMADRAGKKGSPIWELGSRVGQCP